MASTSSPELTQPNWVDLPPEVTADILRRLGPIEILNTARKVCATWRNVCNEPSMWRSIDMVRNADLHDVPIDTDNFQQLRTMCRRAVDLSSGLLDHITVENFGTEELLHYVDDRAPKLRSLRIVSCYNLDEEELTEVAKKLPNLEELQLFFVEMPSEALENFGRCCPNLRSLLTFSIKGFRVPYMEDVSDNETLAIAQTMPGLCHLSLFGNQMSNKGLQAIVNGCPHLESLDLRQCFNVDLGGDMGKLCAQRIKNLKRPNDSTEGYEFSSHVDDWHGYISYDDDISEVSDDDYPEVDDPYMEFMSDKEDADYYYDHYYDY